MKSEAVADWELERFRLGELGADDSGRVAAAVERDEALQARLAALDASDAEILAECSAEAMAAVIRARAAAAPPEAVPARGRMALALAASVVLAAAWAALPRAPQQSLVAPVPDTTRVKGLRPHLIVYRQTMAGAERLASGGVVRPGDTVQVEYVAAGARYGVVVSQDGRGTVTVHLSAGDRAAELARGPAALAASFELDDAPSFEEFYLVTSPGPFAVKTVTEALARAASSRSKGEGTGPRLPSELACSTFLLRKESSR